MSRTMVGGSLVAAFLTMSPAHAQHVSFGGVALGARPPEFVSALTGSGMPGDWKIVEEANAEGGKALGQLGADPTDDRFPLAIYMPTIPSDAEATVHFKLISGKVDQAAGIVMRLIDRNNYYVARANALENNVRFYRVVAGRRTQLATAAVTVTAGSWHSLGLRAEGGRFTVSFDGRVVSTARDETFPTPGKVALWTKADSVIHFDWLEIRPLN